jgi:hypothetical protein
LGSQNVLDWSNGTDYATQQRYVIDQDVESGATYCYRIRSMTLAGLRSNAHQEITIESD